MAPCKARRCLWPQAVVFVTAAKLISLRESLPVSGIDTGLPAGLEATSDAQVGEERAHCHAPPISSGALVSGEIVRSSDWTYRLHEFIEDEYVGASGQVSDRVRSTDNIVTGHAESVYPEHHHRHIYRRAEAIGRGAYGEVWRAVRLSEDGETAEPGSYVLKRLLPRRPRAVLSGWREIYFGAHKHVVGGPHFARFVEHFTRGVFPDQANHDASTSAGADDSQEQELWLVFQDEGISLTKLLYTPRGGSAPGVAAPATIDPSAFWLRMHSQPAAGRLFLHSIVRQLLLALARLHASGIVHRDVKPSNVFVATNDGALRVRLGDFGSAVHLHAPESAHLYPPGGPSSNEVTMAYAPPEVALSAATGDFTDRDEAPGIPFDPELPTSYDMFTLGSTLVELVLGLPASEIFGPLATSAALLQQRSGRSGRHEHEAGSGAQSGTSGSGAFMLETATIAAGFARLCIAPQGQAVVVDAPWMEDTAGETAFSSTSGRAPEAGDHSRSHHRHAHGHAHMRAQQCDLGGFRRVWRRAEAWARRRALQSLREQRHAHAGAGRFDSSGATGSSLSRRASAHLVPTTAPANAVTGALQASHPVGGELVPATIPEDTADRTSLAGEVPPSRHPTLLTHLEATSLVVFGPLPALPGPHPSRADDLGRADLQVSFGVDAQSGLTDRVEHPTVTRDGHGKPDWDRCTPDPENCASLLLGADGEQLLYSLLTWEPSRRPNASQALRQWGYS